MPDILYNTAPAFRNTYFDAQGVPLINGKLESFKASDHGVQKALYQSNIITPPATTPPTYSNPIILDSGASVGPLFYASDENYYLELRDSNDTLIATVDNWNAPANTDPTPKADEVDFTNYFTNPDFVTYQRRKFFSDNFAAGNQVDVANSVWSFLRSNTSATMTLEFVDFTAGQTVVPDNPIRSIKYQSTAVGAGGETYKDLIYTINDVYSLSGEVVTFAFYAKSSQSSQIQLIINQIFGISSAVETIVQAIDLTTSEVKHTITTTIPSIAGKAIDSSSKLEIRFRMPLNVLGDAELSHLNLNRGPIELEYNYLPARYSLGRIHGVNIPDFSRTPIDDKLILAADPNFGNNLWIPTETVGKIVMWPTEITPAGWLSCEGASVTRGLYNRLYEVIGDLYGKYYTTATVSTNVVTVTGIEFGNVTDATAGTSPFTVNVTQQGTGALPEIFTVTTTAATLIDPGDHWTFTALKSLTPKNFYVWYSKENSGIDPAVGGATGIRVDISNTDTADQVAARTRERVNVTEFGLPDMRAYFVRGWDNGAGRDPDAATRTAAPGGLTGDHVGTTQTDDVKPHDHDVEVNLLSAATGINRDTIKGWTGGPASVLTGPVNGTHTESRPINIYMKFIIKY